MEDPRPTLVNITIKLINVADNAINPKLSEPSFLARIILNITASTWSKIFAIESDNPEDIILLFKWLYTNMNKFMTYNKIDNNVEPIL